MKRILSTASPLVLLLILIALPAVALGQDPSPKFDPAAGSILDALRQDKQHFSKMIALIGKSGIKELTTPGQSFTLLAPTDDAFNGLPAPTYDSLLNDPKMLNQFLRAHMLPGKVLVHVLFEAATPDENGKPMTKTLKSVDGSALGFYCNMRPADEGGHHPLINGQVRVLVADVAGTSAVIQVIDRLLPLPSVK